MKRFELTPNNGRKSFHGKCVVVDYGDANVGENHAVLFSYGLEVAEIRGKEFIKLDDYYSATTLSHINAFRDFYGWEKITRKEWEALKVGKGVK